MRLMNITITGNGMVVTPALRAHVVAKLVDAQKLLSSDSNMTICLSVQKGKRQQKDNHTVKVNLRLPGKPNLIVEESGVTMYVAVDTASDKLHRQLTELGKRKAPGRETIRTGAFADNDEKVAAYA